MGRYLVVSVRVRDRVCEESEGSDARQGSEVSDASQVSEVSDKSDVKG